MYVDHPLCTNLFLTTNPESKVSKTSYNGLTEYTTDIRNTYLQKLDEPHKFFNEERSANPDTHHSCQS
jgi:hypothetical protein